MAYAEKTNVSPERTRAEIEKTLSRYGATAFGYAWENGRAIVTFKARERYVRFEVHLPDRNAPAIRLNQHGYVKTVHQIDAAVAQAERQRWRALLLVVKAKLEAVEAGLSHFEEEFLAQIILPDGRTVGEHALTAVAEAYERDEVTPLIPPARPALEAPR